MTERETEPVEVGDVIYLDVDGRATKRDTGSVAGQVFQISDGWLYVRASLLTLRYKPAYLPPRLELL